MARDSDLFCAAVIVFLKHSTSVDVDDLQLQHLYEILGRDVVDNIQLREAIISAVKLSEKNREELARSLKNI